MNLSLVIWIHITLGQTPCDVEMVEIPFYSLMLWAILLSKVKNKANICFFKVKYVSLLRNCKREKDG